MKIRTQLAGALLLLGVLPLLGLVLYSWLSSERAIRQTVATEAAEMAEELDQRMTAARAEVESRFARLGDPEFLRLLIAPSGQGEDEAFVGRFMAEMGEAADMVQAFQFIPEAPKAPAPPPLDDDAAAPPAPPESEWTVEELSFEELRDLEEKLGDLAERRVRLIERHAAAAQERVHAARARQSRARARAERRQSETAETAETAESNPHVLFGNGLEVPIVGEGGEMLGRFEARLSAPTLLHAVLAGTPRERGEVPFAVDPDGDLYVLDESDRPVLEALPTDLAADERTAVLGKWVVARKKDADSGLVFGVARPFGQALAEQRASQLRVFAGGLALLLVALLGVLPLSRRLTRNLEQLSHGAERIAAGDLETEVAVRSRDEVGQLATAFNDMAGKLEEQRRRLIEEERQTREREVERRLLEAGYARKSEELEEARRFQLSLLPSRLPAHPGFEVAVHMRTATEVGGDFYDFQMPAGAAGPLIVAVGDATGHGARAGTMVTVLKSLFTADAGRSGPRDFVVQANRAIKSMELGRMAMALTLVHLEPGLLRACAAGMPPILIHRAARGEVEEIAVEGMPLGGLADFAYREVERPLAAGDTVLLTSDGLPELLGAAGDPFGYAQVRAAFAGAAAAGPEAVLAALRRAADEWSAGAPPGDDVTLVAVRVRG